MLPASRTAVPESALIQEIAGIASIPEVQSAIRWFERHEAQVADWQLRLAAISAPPFGEADRAAWVAQRFRELGLVDVHTDQVGNVFGIRRGLEASPNFVAVSAHLDTVFPAGTAVQPRREGSKLFGPGVSDNAAGISAMLATAAVLQATAIKHLAPLVFIGNVGEEGEGDLRGMRHIFSDPHWSEAISAIVVLDGAGADSIVRLC